MRESVDVDVRKLAVRVRLVTAPPDHDWKGLADVLERLGKRRAPISQPKAQQPEEAIACPS